MVRHLHPTESIVYVDTIVQIVIRGENRKRYQRVLELEKIAPKAMLLIKDAMYIKSAKVFKALRVKSGGVDSPVPTMTKLKKQGYSVDRAR